MKIETDKVTHLIVTNAILALWGEAVLTGRNHGHDTKHMSLKIIRPGGGFINHRGGITVSMNRNFASEKWFIRSAVHGPIGTQYGVKVRTFKTKRGFGLVVPRVATDIMIEYQDLLYQAAKFNPPEVG